MKSTRKKTTSRRKASVKPTKSLSGRSSPLTKSSRQTTTKKRENKSTTVWRDASGRFASPVYFDGKRYRSKRTGKLASFATRALKPSTAAKRAKASGKPVKIVKPKLKRPAKPKPKKPSKAPPKPPKTFISRLFGKDRHTLARKITSEDEARIKEAVQAIEEAREEARKQKKPFGPTVISKYGYEYYELIASIEKMSPHDIYTLMVSPK